VAVHAIRSVALYTVQKKYYARSLSELRIYVPLDTRQVILEVFFPVNLLAWYWIN